MVEIKQNIILTFNVDYDKIVKYIQNIVYLAYLMRIENKSLVRYPNILKDNINQEENEFILRMEEVDVYFKVTSNLVTDYFSYLEWFAYKTEPKSYEYYYTTQVYKTSPTSILLISNFKYSKDINIPIECINRERKRRINIYLNLTKNINQKEMEKLNVEYICINSSIELLWNILLNFKLVQKYVHFLGDRIEYNGKFLKKNLKINVYLNNKLLKFIVNKCSLEFGEGKIEFLIENIFDQKIILLLIGNEEKSVLYIFNVLKYSISEKDSLNLSNKKKGLLKKFKLIVENFINQKENELISNYFNKKNNQMNIL